jgi:hypothetical protein
MVRGLPGRESDGGGKKKAPLARGFFRSLQLLELNDLVGGRTLGALDDLETHPGAFLQGFEALGLDGSVVHEDIRAAILLDEAKTLGIVKPFYRAFSHFLLLLSVRGSLPEPLE